MGTPQANDVCMSMVDTSVDMGTGTCGAPPLSAVCMARALTHMYVIQHLEISKIDDYAYNS